MIIIRSGGQRLQPLPIFNQTCQACCQSCWSRGSKIFFGDGGLDGILTRSLKLFKAARAISGFFANADFSILVKRTFQTLGKSSKQKKNCFFLFF